MYKCQLCKSQSKSGQGQIKRVTEKRTKLYENTVQRGKFKKTIQSQGSEIVREVAVCAPCATQLPA